jgi:mannosidase alpha-like ER degradation enhancer 3
MDNTDGTAAASSPLFAMSGDGVDDIKIPMVFLFMKESKKLIEVKRDILTR